MSRHQQQHRCTRTLWILALAAVSSSVARAQSPPPAAGEPDRAAIARNGVASAERFRRQPAAWTAATRLPNSPVARMIAEVVGSPSARRTVVRLDDPATGGAELFRFVIRDGAWYAVEGGNSGKYRPFEVPFNLPAAYFFIARSNPQFYTEPKEDVGTFEGLKEGVASYLTPLTASLRKRMEAAVQQLQALRGKDQAAAKDAEMTRALEQMRDLLDRGIRTRIEVASGMIVEYGTPDRQTEIRSFRWLDDSPAEALNVDGRTWGDFTGDPTAGGTDDLVMFGHNGIWNPVMTSSDTDGRLVNVKTGAFRRLPYRGAIAMPGCFLPGRTKVVVSGIDGINPGIDLIEIDLKTGENRRLGGDLAGAGMTLMPATSPDGRTLVALHRGADEGAIHSRICVVDLATGQGKLLGTPRDMASLSWLPNGRDVLLLDRESPDPADLDARPVESIVQLDLTSGRIRRIGEGSSPVLLHNGKTILFQDTRTREWKTSDLDGGTVKTFAGGLPDHGFPTPAPDGRRLLMMHFVPALAPAAVVIPIDGGAPRPVPLPSGLWTLPAWR